MRRLLILGLLLLASHASAHADGVADINQPSSSIPGCLNVWLPVDLTEESCEAKADRQRWQEREATIVTAINVLTNASRAPERADKEAVVTALNALAATADGINGSYHPSPRGPNYFAANLAWMRLQLEAFHLPIPDTPGDGFRTLAGLLKNPMLLAVDRNATYDRGTIVALGFNDAVSSSIDAAVQETQTAVRQAHQAAVHAAVAIEDGTYKPAEAAAAIAAAAGPDHAAVAAAETQILEASRAAHDEPGHAIARRRAEIPYGFLSLLGVCLALAIMDGKRSKADARRVWRRVAQVVAPPALIWLVVAVLRAMGVLSGAWVELAWLVLLVELFVLGKRLLPARRSSADASIQTTHGTAHFGTATHAAAANHLAPAAAVDGFALGWMRDTPPGGDARFRQGGHILTCAPTGAGKGIGAVIPNLLDYPGSAFVLDFKGENYAVSARARRAAGQDVFLIDPFGITGAPRHSMNWLDALDPEDPDVVSLSAALADMLVVSSGKESDPHWDEAAKELLRGLLIYAAGLNGDQRSMAEVRRIITSSEEEMADVFGEMMADPQRGQRIVARAATAYVNKPEKERSSVLSTLVRHTGWLDDPRLEAAFSRSDFDLRDLKRRPMTVYVALPPDRLRVSRGFVRGFIGLALNAMTTVQGKPAARVAFFLDEFGQLGRMDSLADNITILRGYGAQLWLFVQDLSQLKAVYPRWQSFMANTTQQFFGTGDYDTAKYVSDTLGQFTIRYQTAGQSSQAGGGNSTSTGEHLQGRSLLTPDEVLRLGPEKPIVMIPGEAPYLLERINYLSDSPYVGRFDENPMHANEVVS
jgi:type IV secretory pathway TraG/TraD family ATPase VirD4